MSWSPSGGGGGGSTPTPDATATQTNVASSVTAVALIAANTNRLYVSVFNDSTANLYLSKSGTASTTNYWIKIPAAGYAETTFTGAISAIWDAANGAARVTEDT